MKKFEIAGCVVKPGERKRIDIKVAKLYDFTDMGIPVEVIRGKKEGPTLFVSAAIHGDEINGTEIIKRLLMHKGLNKIRGTLIAVPIVNVFGFNSKSRYLPDRRDLNRCFPGSKNGSLAARLAESFMREIVLKCTHGIDLHTAAIHRTNLPQIRACLDDKKTKQLAHAFNVPVILNSALRDGSLRESARFHGIPILLFEGGEALRHNENVIRAGLRGVLSVMREIEMLPQLKYKSKYATDCFVASSSNWVRAPHSGVISHRLVVGCHIKKDDLLGVISDPFGHHEIQVRSPCDGILIGMIMMPLVTRGDAVFHIATFKDSKDVKESMDEHHELSGYFDASFDALTS